ncbi:catalase [Granulicella aggregans]|uniref:catalase n=1 Tax=Granulicella aggregans TaxID=474949 RepID=UPI0032B11FF3
MVCARGFGAQGYFELTDSLVGVTRAKIFNQVGGTTGVFTRFSTQNLKPATVT